MSAFALTAALLDDCAAERFRSHRALRALLDDLAGGRAFLLAVDDLKWADEAS